MVNFNLVERLATNILLGCAYCDRHIEAMKLRKRIVELMTEQKSPLPGIPEEEVATKYLYKKLNDFPKLRKDLRPKLVYPNWEHYNRNPKNL